MAEALLPVPGHVSDLHFSKWISTRFPSSTLLSFLFGGLLIKAEYEEKGTLIIKGLLGNLVKLCSLWGSGFGVD